MKVSWRIRRTTLLAIVCIAFLGGIGFARTKIVLTTLLLLLVFVFATISLFKQKAAAILGAILLGFVLGWWRGQSFFSQLKPLETLQGDHIVATIRAESDAVYDDRSQLSFDADHIHITDPRDVMLPGVIAVGGFGEPAIFKGDIVQIEGKVYASRGSRQLRMSFAELKVLGRTNSPIDTLRRKFAAGMETALPEPLASFGLGLLIGQRTTLPDHTTAALATVGLTHIIAVSGYNLTIILRGVRRLLKKRSKYQITIVSAGLTIVFLLATGLSASIVRAGLVSGLSLVAWYYGRRFRPVLLIAFVAALTAGFNPFYVWSDIGWYLSFLAFFGVLVISPLLHARFFKDKEPKALAALMLETVCALIMTVPFIMYIFEQVSLIALIANIVVVPLVPLAMLFALVAGIAGMVIPILAGIFAIPANIMLTYMLDMTELMSRIPHILARQHLSLTAMLFLYGCVVISSCVLWHTARKNVKITDITTEI